MNKLPLLWKLSTSFTRRDKKSFVIPLIAIIVGLTGLIVILGVINGFDNLLIDSLTSFFPHVLISDTETQILDTREIQAIFPLNIDKGVISTADTFSGFLLYETNSAGLEYMKQFVVSGTLPKIGEILIGKVMAKELVVEIGETIQLSRLMDGKPTSVSAVISGIISTGLYQFDSSLAISEGNSNGYTAIYFKDPRIATSFKDNLPASVKAHTWEELNSSFSKALKIDELIALIITTFVLLLSGFGISNSVLYSVLTRRKEIGILSSMGLSPREISWVFGLQSFIIAIFGIIIGTVLGLSLSFALSKISIPLPSDLFYTDHLPVNLKVDNILMAILFEFGLTIFFSMFPAIKAGKTDPMEVLSYE